MIEWQLIETAPHGLDVLMGWVECHSKEWKCEVGQASYGWSINGISNMSRHGSATHWMPLPAPPRGALKTEASASTEGHL